MDRELTNEYAAATVKFSAELMNAFTRILEVDPSVSAIFGGKPKTSSYESTATTERSFKIAMASRMEFRSGGDIRGG